MVADEIRPVHRLLDGLELADRLLIGWEMEAGILVVGRLDVAAQGPNVPLVVTVAAGGLLGVADESELVGSLVDPLVDFLGDAAVVAQIVSDALDRP